MKKLLSLIMAVGLSFGLCFASANGLNKVYAADGVAELEDYAKNTSMFVVSPQVVLNQETGCYDIDINVLSANGYFSNFEAEIECRIMNRKGGNQKIIEGDSSGSFIEGDLPKAKVTTKQYVKGNAAASLKNGILSVVFNAPSNVALNNFGYNGGAMFGIKVFTVKTDLKYNDYVLNASEEGVFDIGLWFTDGEVKSAGVMNLEKRVVIFDECGLDDRISELDSMMCIGDYDFDGTLTINDLIAAQYYLTNRTEFLHLRTLNLMLDSVCLQYLQMYLCESISYFDYIEAVAKKVAAGGGEESGEVMEGGGSYAG